MISVKLVQKGFRPIKLLVEMKTMHLLIVAPVTVTFNQTNQLKTSTQLTNGTYKTTFKMRITARNRYRKLKRKEDMRRYAFSGRAPKARN